jgi:hypothetical protein
MTSFLASCSSQTRPGIAPGRGFFLDLRADPPSLAIIVRAVRVRL